MLIFVLFVGLNFGTGANMMNFDRGTVDVEPLDPTNIFQTSATLNGVSYSSVPIQACFLYGLTDEITNSTQQTSFQQIHPCEPPFSETITDLNPATTYHWWVYGVQWNERPVDSDLEYGGYFTTQGKSIHITDIISPPDEGSPDDYDITIHLQTEDIDADEITFDALVDIYNNDNTPPTLVFQNYESGSMQPDSSMDFTFPLQWSAEYGEYEVQVTIVEQSPIPGATSYEEKIVLIEEAGKPEVKITYPTDGLQISDSITIRGTAYPEGSNEIETVYVSIDEGSFLPAEGTADWTYPWDIKDYEDGIHQIKAMSYNGKYSEIDAVSVTIKRDTANVPPEADFIFYPEEVLVNCEVTFDATSSKDQNGDELTYFWDFGDGTTAMTSDPITCFNHIYSELGPYDVSMTVTDDKEASDSITKTVNVVDVIQTRDRAMLIAEGYASHTWEPISEPCNIQWESNIYHGLWDNSIEVHTPNREYYSWSDSSIGWQAGVENTGVPYQWGGFSSIPGFYLRDQEDFDDQYKGVNKSAGKIHAAGDIYWRKSSECDGACGVDCSGFVSRCWDLTDKRGSDGLINSELSHQIPFGALKKGDMLYTPGHVMLFESVTGNEINVYEASGQDWKVSKRSYSVNANQEDSSITLNGVPYQMFAFNLFESLDFHGGLRQVKMDVINYGSKTYTDVEWVVNVKGTGIGILSNSISERIDLIPPGETESISIGPLFGFGTIEIMGFVNIPELDRSNYQHFAEGIVFGPLVFIK